MAKLHDLVHVLDHSNAMNLGWLRSSPCVITCHDLLAIRAAQGEFAETATGWTGRLLQRWILHGLRTAPYVACVSAKTQADFQRLTGRADRFVRVLPHALHGSFLPGVALPSAGKSGHQ